MELILSHSLITKTTDKVIPLAHKW
ncbi:hypothetical protein BN189_4280001 [Clostridioides difficile T10]|nr:hypothetical protein BN186_2270001 [Clostridioides difficile E23]CCL89653.1 hypothetical protein BN189_4280001 [Clostridioides difficile T10]